MSAKSDVMVKLSFVFVISLLSFAIGTFVGKKYSDNQHQLAVLEPSAQREVASVEEGAEKPEMKTGTMTDDEIAKLAEEFVTDETEVPAKEVVANEEEHGKADEHGEADAHAVPAKVAKVPAKAEATHGKSPAHAEEASNAAKNVVAGNHEEVAVAPKKATPRSRVPSSLPKDVAQYNVGKFTVQVASYTEESEAQNMASDLKKKGYSAFYIPAQIKGKTYYRVSVGQFATQKEAQAYRGELMSKTKVGAAIVQKITE